MIYFTRRLMYKLLILFLFFESTPLMANESALSNQINDHEKRIGQLQEEITLLKNQATEEGRDASLENLIEKKIGDSPIIQNLARLNQRAQIHGFISQGFLLSSHNNFYCDSKDGSLEFNETGVNFTAMLSNKMHAGIQLFSRDLGDIGNNKVELDWAYGEYRHNNWLGMRAGKIKIFSGLYNKNRDIDVTRTWIFLPYSVYLESARDNHVAVQGAALFGTIPMGRFGVLNYESVRGLTNLDKDGGTGKFAEDQFPMQVNEIDNEGATVNSLIWDTPLDGLRIATGLSDMEIDFYAEYAQDIPNYHATKGENFVYHLDTLRSHFFCLEYIYDNLTMAAEYKQVKTEQHINNGDKWDNYAEGWYVNAAYRFLDWFEVGLGYSEYYPNKDDKEGRSFEASAWNPTPDYQAWQKDITLCTRFDLTENLIFKLEGHLIDGVAAVFTSDNGGDANNLDKNWNLVAAKLTYVF